MHYAIFIRDDNLLMCEVREPGPVATVVWYDEPVYGSLYTRKSIRRAVRKAFGKSIKFHSQ